MNCKEECMKQKKDGTLKDCPNVKENEQLKEQIEKMKEELKNNYYVQLLQKEKAELAEDFAKQIEKMKNCGNCNGIINGIRQEKCHFCMRSKLLPEWELAE